jgi:prepilin-type processing-associated H-X9-DG protein
MKKTIGNGCLKIAVLAMCILTVKATAERTAAEELTGFVPENTLGFVATSGGENLKGSFDDSRLGQIWQEASIQEFYGRVKSAFCQLVDTAVRKEEGNTAAEKTWSILAFVKTILQQPMLIGVAEKPGEKVPVYGFVIVKSGDRQSQIQSAVNKFVESDQKFKDKVEIIQIDSTKIFKLAKDDIVFLWGWVADYFVFTVNDGEARIFQRLTSANLDDLRATKFPGLEKVQDPGRLVIKYVNMERILKLLTSEAGNNGAKDEDLVKARNILDEVGASAIKTMVAKADFSGPNMTGNALITLDGNRNGIFKTLGKVDLKNLDKVPAGAIGVCIWNVDLGGIYDVLMAAIKSADENAFTETTREIEKYESEGIRIFHQGLLASLTGEMVSYELPASGTMAGLSADGVLLAKLKDPKLFTSTVIAFTDYVAKKQIKEFEIMQQEVNGRTYTVVMVPQLAMMQISPTWTVEGDWVIAGTNMMQVNAALHAATQPAQGGTIRDTEGFKAMTQSLPSDLVCFRYSDQAAQMKDFLQTAQQFWPVVVMGLQKQANVNLPMMLPSQENIVKHLGPAAEYWWFDSEGLRYHGQGAMLTANAQMVAGAAFGVGVALPAFNKARESAKRQVSLSNLRQIGLACLMYANDHDGKLPEKLDELISTKYLKDNKVLVSPIRPKLFSGAPDYHYVSGAIQLSKIKEPAEFILVYENPAYQKEGTNVLFADGHVVWMPPAEFRKSLEATYRELGKPVPSVLFQGENVPTSTPATSPAGDAEKLTPANCREIPCGETAKKNETKSAPVGETKS